MTLKVLQTGLDPDVIDFSAPGFRQFAGLTPQSLRKANDDNVAGLRAAGFDVDNVLIDLGDTAIAVIAAAIDRTRYDAVLIGAGVRLVAANTVLFEALVNLVHARLPGARFVFNRDARSTPDDILRWFDGPDAASPRA